jgi:hypothetical protein
MVRSGYVAANSVAIGPPSEKPITMARSESTASMTALASSIRTSRDGSRSSGTRSESPVPRLSKRINRENAASRERNRASVGSSHISSMWVVQPITKAISTGPVPTVWYAM